MPLSELMLRGLALLGLGVGALLALMVCLRLLVGQVSHWCARCQPVPAAPLAVRTADLEQERVAAIAVAVHAYRSRLRHGLR